MTAGASQVAARLLFALGEAGGAISLDEAAAGETGAAVDAAVDRLTGSGLVALGSDGILRAGARGSLLSARAVAGYLDTRWAGRSLDVRPSLGSTNDAALDAAARGAAPGLVVVTEHQSAGRGRRGRAFDSLPGLGLWSTTVLPEPPRPEAAPRGSLLAALAVLRAVEMETGVRAGFKWPNDVRIDGRKVCGILVEARTAGGRMFSVAGIGLNVHHRRRDFPPEIRDSATSLELASGRRLDRNSVLATLIGALEWCVDEDRAGRVDLARSLAPFDEMRGREVVVEGSDRRVVGVAGDIRDDGSLVLRTAQGESVVRSGELSLREA